MHKFVCAKQHKINVATFTAGDTCHMVSVNSPEDLCVTHSVKTLASHTRKTEAKVDSVLNKF